MRRNPNLFERKELCCGCTACYAVCPQNAIEMLEDEEGFEYPAVDYGKCIGCLLCENVCPVKRKMRITGLKNDE